MKTKLLTALTLSLCLFFFTITNAQTISTIAGNTVAGYSGDGGTATSAELNLPNGIAVDAAGNIYIGDYYNHVVRKVNASGIISTIAGTTVAGYSGDGGAATSAKLNGPCGVAVDAAGNVYIADKGNNAIRKINTSGVISTIAGNTVAGYSGDGGTAISAELYFPSGVAIDAAGNIYIADCYNYAIRKVNTSGTISTIAGNNALGYSGDGGVATSAKLNYPWGVAVDVAGNVYIGDEDNNVIRKVNTSGMISTIAGNTVAGYSGDGGLATSAKLNTPNTIAVDAAGNVYIDDVLNNVIRKVNTSGMISTIAGNTVAGYSGDGGLASSSKLDRPTSIAMDAAGNIYFTDQYNNVVRKITASTAGIDQLSLFNAQINIYPNPNSGIFSVRSDVAISSIEILNILGEKIYSSQPTLPGQTGFKNIEIDLKEARGTYFVRLTQDNITFITKKIIITE